MQKFRLKKEHIALLKKAYVSWDSCEFGAPSIDCKRPYGNSDVKMDMVDILGYKVFEDSYGEKHLTKEQSDFLDKLHQETKTALQIILRNIDIQLGDYEADDYSTNWKLLNNPKS